MHSTPSLRSPQCCLWTSSNIHQPNLSSDSITCFPWATLPGDDDTLVQTSVTHWPVGIISNGIAENTHKTHMQLNILKEQEKSSGELLQGQLKEGQSMNKSMLAFSHHHQFMSVFSQSPPLICVHIFSVTTINLCLFSQSPPLICVRILCRHLHRAKQFWTWHQSVKLCHYDDVSCHTSDTDSCSFPWQSTNKSKLTYSQHHLCLYFLQTSTQSKAILNVASVCKVMSLCAEFSKYVHLKNVYVLRGCPCWAL